MKKAESNDMISIVVPAYNSEKVIRNTIDSVINQTYKNIELIVINDGSKDKTLDILKEYEKKYNFIKVIDKENAGQAEARNDGLKLAKGKYVSFLDADDFFEKNYLEVMHAAIIKDDLDLVITGFKRYDSNLKYMTTVSYTDTFWTRYITCVCWGKLYKTSFLKKNNIIFPKVKNGEDTAFSITANTYTDKIKVLEDNSGYCYYYNETGLSKYTFKGFQTNIIPANQYIIDNLNKDYYKKNEKILWYFFIKHSIFYILWSGKVETRKRFVEKNKELMNWLEDNVDLFKKKKLTSIFYPKGEVLSVRIIVAIYMLLNKLHLIGLFALMYCRGKKKNG